MIKWVKLIQFITIIVLYMKKRINCLIFLHLLIRLYDSWSYYSVVEMMFSITYSRNNIYEIDLK